MQYQAKFKQQSAQYTSIMRWSARVVAPNLRYRTNARGQATEAYYRAPNPPGVWSAMRDAVMGERDRNGARSQVPYTWRWSLREHERFHRARKRSPEFVGAMLEAELMRLRSGAPMRAPEEKKSGRLTARTIGEALS